MKVQQNNTNKTMADEIHQAPSAKTACGGKLKDPKNLPSALYRGEQIYFCAIACLRAFEHNPDAFIAGEIEHPADAA